jgi:hypothetical protein
MCIINIVDKTSRSIYIAPLQWRLLSGVWCSVVVLCGVSLFWSVGGVGMQHTVA